MSSHRIALLLLAACHGTSDQLQADAPLAIDGASADATDASVGPVGPVMIKVLTWTGDGAPDPTAVVFFYDAAGNVVQTTMVDAQGRAAGPAGGDVTVLQAHTDPMDLTQRFERF
jgi:hypothetical protein